MRIIAGVAKGRSLRSPPSSATRPMMDRAREALFSSLGGLVAGARVLDLYAGSGSLGLEALSRGAASAVFVEAARPALTVLRQNVEAVGLGGEIVGGDVLLAMPGLSGPFDLVFVDPPFADPDEAVDVVLEAAADVTRAGGVVVVHRRAGSRRPAASGLALSAERRYGDTVLWRFVK